MSNHISHNDPKQPCQCATPAVSKHNITPKDLEHGGCGCHQQDLSPSRLDQVIEQYEAMKEEAAAARDEFVQKARGLDDIAHETRATTNRNAILNAIGNLNFSKPFAEKVGNSIIFHDVTPRQLAQLTRIIGKKVPSLEPSELYFFIVTDPNDEERRNLKVGAYGIEFTEIAFSFANGDDGLVVSKIEVDLPGEEYGWEFVGVSYFGYDDIISNGDLSWRIAEARQSILDALSHISPTDPNSLALAQFFGVTLLEGYEFMTDTEVCGELEDIMQLVDPDLTAAQAAAITEQTLNPSES